MNRLSKHYIWMTLGRNPVTLPVLGAYQRARGRDSAVVTSDTELVVEGYPRSANTYAVACIRVLNAHPPRLAHHIHGSAQITEGVRRGLPVILLLREPVAAIVSTLQRKPGFDPEFALSQYTDFHSPILQLTAKIVVAPFEQVTTDFGAVLEVVNRKFGLSLETRLDDNRRLEVGTLVEQMDRADRGSESGSEDSVARPSEARAKRAPAIAETLHGDYPDAVATARDIYERLLATSR